jgi:hypothetical protein
VCFCTREREGSTWRCREGHGAGGEERVVVCGGLGRDMSQGGGGCSSMWGCREGYGSTNLEIALPIHAFGQALRVRQVAVGVEDG